MKEYRKEINEIMKKGRQAVRKSMKQHRARMKSHKKDLGFNQTDTIPSNYADMLLRIQDSLALQFLIGKSALGLEIQDKIKLKSDLIKEYSKEMSDLALELQKEIQIEVEDALELQEDFENDLKIELEEKMEDLHFELQEFLGDYNLGSRDIRKGDNTEGGFDELSIITININDLVAQKLLEDGLIDDTNMYFLKIKNGKLTVNNQLQSDEMYQNWVKYISSLGKGEIDSKSKVFIERKNGKDQFSIEIVE